jgi:TRAP-type C4-dicarboxylate transport system permease small subunit
MRRYPPHIVTTIAGGLVGLLFFVLFGQILLRTFARPLIWVEEFSTFAFIWLVFAGATLAYLKGEHLEVDLFHGWAAKRLGRRAMAAWDLAILILQLIFLGVFAIGLVVMTRQSWSLYAGSLPGFRFGWIYLGVLGAALASITILVVHLWMRLRPHSPDDCHQ